MIRAVLLTLALLAVAGAPRSGADFTASSSSPANRLTAAADFNTVAVTLADPGATLQGTVSLTATATSGRGIASVQIDAAAAGSGAWSTVCATDHCSWDTTAIADGRYDLRAVATDAAGYSRTANVTSRTVDNVAPAVSVTPVAFIGGAATLNATASDAGTGVQDVTIQQRAQGATTWTTVCRDTTAPYSCSLNTVSLGDGMREISAIARDGAGHATQSATVTTRVDNTAASLNGTTMPATVQGQLTVSASPSDDESGIYSVTWQAQYAGTWYDACTDYTAPYTCSVDTRQVADGSYNARIVVTNGAGVKTTSSTFVVTADNTPPKGVDVQAGNGGGVAGQLDPGDWLTLTWSEPIAPGSVLAGWTGAAQAVRVKVTAADQLAVCDATGTSPLALGSFNLGADLVTAAADFDATMVQSGNAITITLGALRSGTLALVPAGAGTLTWTPSALAKDLAGNASTTTAVTETGTADVDF